MYVYKKCLFEGIKYTEGHKGDDDEKYFMCLYIIVR